jgi:hypothetical protein
MDTHECSYAEKHVADLLNRWSIMNRIIITIILVFAAYTVLYANPYYAYIDFSKGGEPEVYNATATFHCSFSEPYNSYVDNSYDSSYHLYLYEGGAFSGHFNIPEGATRATLRIKHLTSAAGKYSGYSPVKVTINGNDFTTFSRLSSSYQVDEFDISEYLKKNNGYSDRLSIVFDYSEMGSTGYWIKSIQVFFKP